LYLGNAAQLERHHPQHPTNSFGKTKVANHLVLKLFAVPFVSKPSPPHPLYTRPLAKNSYHQSLPLECQP